MKNSIFKKTLKRFNNTLKIGIVLCCLVNIQVSFGQTEEITWHEILQQNGVKVFYAVGDCNEGKQLLIKATNGNNAYAVTNFILTTNQANNSGSPVLISLEANEEQIINCENYQLHPTIMMVAISNPLSFSCSAKEVKINLHH